MCKCDTELSVDGDGFILTGLDAPKGFDFDLSFEISGESGLTLNQCRWHLDFWSVKSNFGDNAPTVSVDSVTQPSQFAADQESGEVTLILLSAQVATLALGSAWGRLWFEFPIGSGKRIPVDKFQIEVTP